MQILKEHVKDNILKAAEEIYFQEGYSQASLRSIAARCGITVGNLYRYFENKEALLDAVLKPLLDDVALIVGDLLSEQSLNDRKKHQQFHLRVAERLSLLTQSHHHRISIMISGVGGTKYASYFQDLIHRVAVGIQKVVLIAKPFIQINPIIYEVMAKNHVEGLVFIITQIAEPEEQKKVIQQFLDVHLHYFETIDEE